MSIVETFRVHFYRYIHIHPNNIYSIQAKYSYLRQYKYENFYPYHMKKNKLYYFSVEGENEKWYFEHLQKLINSADSSKYNVRFDIKIDKSPLSRKKSITVPVFDKQKLTVFHVMDYESNTPVHTEQFKAVLDELKEIRVKYNAYNFKLGYSNFAFELWLVLHKCNGITPINNRKNYIKSINEAYGIDFEKMKENKHEASFAKLLNQIDLESVKLAVRNARQIRQYQESIGHTIVEYKGFKHYRDNPDLTVNECVASILKECGIIS